MLVKLCFATAELSVLLAPIMLILLLIAPVLGKRYTAKLRCFVWLVLAVRMLVPFVGMGERPLILHIFPSSQVQTAATTGTAALGAFTPREGIAPEGLPLSPNHGNDAVSPKSKLPRFTIPQLLAAIWLAGAASLLLYHMMAYRHTCRSLRRWSNPVKDSRALDTLARIQKEYSVYREVKLYQSDKADCPLLYGFFRPRILLPQNMLCDTQLATVLRHELLHLKRGDLWYKLLILLAQSIHWYNPLVYWMGRQADLDIEAACDADVLRDADGSIRKEYGLVLLSVVERRRAFATPLTTLFSGSGRQVKQRFADIVSSSGKKKGTALMCIVLALALCSGVLVGCGTQTLSTAAPNQEMQTQSLEQPLVTENSSDILTQPDPDVTDTPMEEMEKQFLSDLSQNQIQQANVLAELDSAYSTVEWDKNPYKGGEMIWPAPGVYAIRSPYGWRFNGSDFHTGMDISGADVYGSAIVAANDGEVKHVNLDYTPGVGYGIYLIIDHGGGVSTLYAQCSAVVVQPGDFVKKGQKIAEIGSTGWSTGPHLHFEVRVDGKHVDPLPYVSDSNQTGVGFIWPTNGGEISDGVHSYPNHNGVDIPRPDGTPVYASAGGTVSVVENALTGYGNHIIIDHGNGYQTLYGHNSTLYVSVGDKVEQGQVIAAVGRSGNAPDYMLHFEVRYNGNNMNPEDYLSVQNDQAVVPE